MSKAKLTLERYVFIIIRLLLRKIRQLEKLAYIDELTGVPNRRYWDSQLDSMIDLFQSGIPAVLPEQVERREGQGGVQIFAQLAVFVIDLDGFKQVNDTGGHAAGDVILVAVADAMQQVLRHGSFLARIGGDEFAVYALVMDEKEASAIAERLRTTVLGVVVKLDDFDWSVRASIGYTLLDPLTDDAATVTKRADGGTYEAKKQKNRGVGAHVFVLVP